MVLLMKIAYTTETNPMLNGKIIFLLFCIIKHL